MADYKGYDVHVMTNRTSNHAEKTFKLTNGIRLIGNEFSFKDNKYEILVITPASMSIKVIKVTDTD